MSDPMKLASLYFWIIFNWFGYWFICSVDFDNCNDHTYFKGDGTWSCSRFMGAAQATAAGLGIGLGGILNDISRSVVGSEGLNLVVSSNAAFSYLVVYHLEIFLLFLTLAFLGPLSQYLSSLKLDRKKLGKFGFSEMPT